MDHFEYIMVLISIIIGLGIAHILLGIGGIVDRLTGRGEQLTLRLAYFAWLANTFLYLVGYWWWEFRFTEFVEVWSVGLYFFLIIYAVVLFLTAAILVPRNWRGVTDLGDFFLGRRAWFYSAYLLVICLDILDSYLKNGIDYIVGQGVFSVAFWLASVAVCVFGIRSARLRFHMVAGVVILIWNVLISFVSLPVLGF
jgi:hypothetical protein